MSVFALICALCLEQYRPISNNNMMYLTFIRFANFIERTFNGGQFRHGLIAWAVIAIPLILLNIILFWVLYHFSPILGWLWCVGVLYANMGFRQFSHAFTVVSERLRDEDVIEARKVLSKWTGQDSSQMSTEEISTIAIEQGTLDSLRYVFAPIFWFVLVAPFLGPTGIILYRINTLLLQKWGGRADLVAFSFFVSKVQYALDWLPARLMAVSFAVMGNFEDAIHCWRTQAKDWVDHIQGILLASAAGALGVCLGSVITQNHVVKMRPNLGMGETANPDFLRSAVGLIWRVVLLWIVVIFLLSFFSWVF